ncbi:MAG: hypothetical protein FWE35_25395 [Streptosporangiales bacterium]|jgi:Mg/Co/Ni transporter MgtE|nr:hypothetical protein [Streptosporangiales bacterium]
MHGNWSGLILAVFIGLGIAWVFNKGRSKWGKAANGKTLVGTAVAVAVILLIIYSAATAHH